MSSKISLRASEQPLDLTIIPGKRMSDAKSNESNLQLVASAEASTKWITKIKIVASSISLFVRLTASFVAAACDGWLRKQRTIVRKLKELLVEPSAVVLSSKFSFPSITGAIHSHLIGVVCGVVGLKVDTTAIGGDECLNTAGGHILQMQKRDALHILPETVTQKNKLDSVFQALAKPISSCRPSSRWFLKRSSESNSTLEPEKSVHVEILYDPSPAEIKADVIFIHGLHGSLFNTWKQGLWGYRKQVQNLPLEHKYKLEECEEYMAETPKSIQEERLGGNEIRHQTDTQEQSEYNHLLENITDLINNIDDKIKESQNGSAANESESESYSSCWPRDWLPKDCPGVRIIAVNYTTDPFLWRPVWITKRIRSSMPQRSQQMEDILLEFGIGQHPIIWVGHSKGGLFVKQMLVDARNSEDPRLRALLKNTKGIMFYSVPHRGSSLAHWNLPLLRQSIELTEVKKDCQEVLELHRKFLKLYEEKSLKAEVFSFVETILTFMWVTNVRVVSVDSADLGLGSFQGVNIDHREICKPLNRDCFLYKELTSLIQRVV